MINTVFLICITLFPAILLAVGIKILPREKWQIIGTIPVKKKKNGSWKGLNLTYYGLFNAIASGFSASLVFVLLGALQIHLSIIFAIVIAVISICIPASKLMAQWVEKKTNTLTIGGASFIGYLFLPWALWAVDGILENQSGFTVMVGLSAVSIAYVFGESLGRLACISFGCCYGKPFADLPGFLQKIFSHFCFTFVGKTKKIAYASGFDEQKVFPIQAITAVLYLLVGIFGVVFFLEGKYGAAFLVTVILSQTWRFLSEFLRADYRGVQKVSAYQLMSLLIIVYAVIVAFYFNVPTAMPPNVIWGLKTLWHPLVIFGIQAAFVTTFLFTGRSHVTYSRILFFVSKESI